MPCQKLHPGKVIPRKDIWVPGIIWAVVIAVAAPAVHYGVSGPEYHHVLPKDVLRHQIASLELPKGPLEARIILQCAKKCFLKNSCASFAVRPRKGLCYLSSLNRCTDQNAILLVSEDDYYFEKFDASEPYPPTCFTTCRLNNHTCTECGRPNCWGNRCQQCATTCWERRDKTDNKTFLYADDQKSVKKVFCNGNWQLWWGKDVKSADVTPNKKCVLRVIIVYNNGKELSTDFDSVSVENTNELSVGEPLKEDATAGNWWEAPFDGRKLRSFSNSNCRPFFTPNRTCISHTTNSVEKQREFYNSTVIMERGYAWLTSNDSYDNVPISDINLWVKCKEYE